MKNDNSDHLLKRRFNLPGPQADLPYKGELRRSFLSFSFKNQVILLVLLVITLLSFVIFILQANDKLLLTTPTQGGDLVEGVTGSPRFINPLLALSETDRDLTALVYSGLMRQDGKGNLVPDLAESYIISPDGLTYTFILKDDLRWHDGKKITAEDIAFTIDKAKDPLIKSSKRAGWEGVSTVVTSDLEIQFILKRPYSPFLENTTLGILPKHLWIDVGAGDFTFSELNTDGVGSGPYKISKIKKSGSGVPTYYDLVPFNDFALGSPYIERLRVRFYPNIDDLVRAFDRGKIDSMGAIRPETAVSIEESGDAIEKIELPRVFGIFFNQNEAGVFTNKEVRKALDIALDKEKIVKEILFDYGVAIDHPIPPGSLGYIAREDDLDDRLATATNLLETNGWSKNDEGVFVKELKSGDILLSFTITTASIPELKSVAEAVAKTWRELGASVDVQLFETGDLNQNIIRPRKYEALLFGEILGKDPDPFSFWHSSQRLDPGLNIALYASISGDKLLEDARITLDRGERIEKYLEFQAELSEDRPAVFIYSPYFLYSLPEKVRGEQIAPITIPAERFSNIYQWYIDTEKVWKILN